MESPSRHSNKDLKRKSLEVLRGTRQVLEARLSRGTRCQRGSLNRSRLTNTSSSKDTKYLSTRCRDCTRASWGLHRSNKRSSNFNGTRFSTLRLLWRTFSRHTMNWHREASIPRQQLRPWRISLMFFVLVDTKVELWEIILLKRWIRAGAFKSLLMISSSVWSPPSFLHLNTSLRYRKDSVSSASSRQSSFLWSSKNWMCN